MELVEGVLVAERRRCGSTLIWTRVSRSVVATTATGERAGCAAAVAADRRREVERREVDGASGATGSSGSSTTGLRAHKSETLERAQHGTRRRRELERESLLKLSDRVLLPLSRLRRHSNSTAGGMRVETSLLENFVLGFVA